VSKVYKTPFKKRVQQTQYKLNNWSYVRNRQKEYMREYRKSDPGKTITRTAGREWARRNVHAIVMYQTLINLAEADDRFKRRTGPYKTITQDGTRMRKVRRR
jgi:hypothetical protein